LDVETAGVNVFVLNAGSSSLKAAYFKDDAWLQTREPAWSADIRWTHLPAHAQLTWSTYGSADGDGSQQIEIGEYADAITALIAAAVKHARVTPEIIGHRVVHGLDESRCALVDARIRGVIEAAAELAPLHNPAALAGIDVCAARFPGVAQAVDFDTAFHTTLPPAAAAYALPYDWFETRGVRRYGFHGISHRYCAQRTAEVLAVPAHEARIVSAHLGNGCSLAAVVGGRSVATTMGYTPLDGLMMGTRSGSVDPGLVLHLLRTSAYTVAELERILSNESGLAGVSGVSEDVRDVIAAAERGLGRAQLALDMFVSRISAGIAGMAVATGGIDALAFTGGIGEHSDYVRTHVCARLGLFGIVLGTDGSGEADREIGDARSTVRVAVIAAREEYAIARDVAVLARDARGVDLGVGA